MSDDWRRDAALSVYATEDGKVPFEVVGRDEALGRVSRLLSATAASGRQHDLLIRGVPKAGKSVVLSASAQLARHHGFDVVAVWAREGGGVVEALTEGVRARSGVGGWIDRSVGGREISSVSVAGVGVGWSARAAESPVDSLVEALVERCESVVRDRGRGVLVTVDDLHLASSGDLRALDAALARVNRTRSMVPLAVIGSGAHEMFEVDGGGEWRRELRTFDEVTLPVALSRDAVVRAVTAPAAACGVEWDAHAVEEVVRASGGAPARVQYYADACWQGAAQRWLREAGPRVITSRDAQVAVAVARGSVEQTDLRRVWLTLDGEQRPYVAALAVLGGQARMVDIAHTLDRAPDELRPVWRELLRRGTVVSPVDDVLQFADPVVAPFVLERHVEEGLSPSLGVLQERADAGRVRVPDRDWDVVLEHDCPWLSGDRYRPAVLQTMQRLADAGVEPRESLQRALRGPVPGGDQARALDLRLAADLPVTQGASRVPSRARVRAPEVPSRRGPSPGERVRAPGL